MKAILRKGRISPKKANIVASIIRGKKVETALLELKHLPKKAASMLEKLLASAAANAENNFGQDTSKLVIKTILVTKGPTYKRFVPISRGRVHPIRKRTSHITIELDIESVTENRKKEETTKTEKEEKSSTKKS